MYALKLFFLTLVEWGRQLWELPRSIAEGAAHWRQRAAAQEAEIERLDRIRNPSKYLGK